MNKWYLCTVRYTKEFSTGELKRVNEKYLISAINFTEAEARAHHEVGQHIRGEFVVKALAHKEIADVFKYMDCDVWYQMRVTYVTSDADTGKEKRMKVNYLVEANGIDEANARLMENIKNLHDVVDVIQITKTEIQEIFEYDPNFVMLNQRHTENFAGGVSNPDDDE